MSIIDEHVDQEVCIYGTMRNTVCARDFDASANSSMGGVHYIFSGGPSVRCPCLFRMTLFLSSYYGGIPMKLGTNIHHVMNKPCGQDFQGHVEKVKVIPTSVK